MCSTRTSRHFILLSQAPASMLGPQTKAREYPDRVCLQLPTMNSSLAVLAEVVLRDVSLRIVHNIPNCRSCSPRLPAFSIFLREGQALSPQRGVSWLARPIYYGRHGLQANVHFFVVLVAADFDSRWSFGGERAFAILAGLHLLGFRQGSRGIAYAMPRRTKSLGLVLSFVVLHRTMAGSNCWYNDGKELIRTSRLSLASPFPKPASISLRFVVRLSTLITCASEHVTLLHFSRHMPSVSCRLP